MLFRTQIDADNVANMMTRLKLCHTKKIDGYHVHYAKTGFILDAQSLSTQLQTTKSKFEATNVLVRL
jgi:hypothetical protein